MLDVVNNTISLNSKRYERPQVVFRGEQAPVDIEQKPDTFETKKKRDMTRGKKIAIGVGALIGLVAAGFGIKKGLDMRAANRISQNLTEETSEAQNIVNEVVEDVTQVIDESLKKMEFPSIVDLLKKFDINSDMELADKMDLSEFKNFHDLFLHNTIKLDNGFKLKIMKDLPSGQLSGLTRFNDKDEIIYSLRNNWKTDCTTIKFEDKECCYFRGTEKSMTLKQDNKIINYDSRGNFVSIEDIKN